MRYTGMDQHYPQYHHCRHPYPQHHQHHHHHYQIAQRRLMGIHHYHQLNHHRLYHDLAGQFPPPIQCHRINHHYHHRYLHCCQYRHHRYQSVHLGRWGVHPASALSLQSAPALHSHSMHLDSHQHHYQPTPPDLTGKHHRYRARHHHQNLRSRFHSPHIAL